jgi:hypothetical protein
MATKYGYVQQDPQDTQLNWNQIATDTVDMLNAEVKTREDKKAAIDQATADYQTILNNVPQGENTQLNEYALNAADKLQKQMLMQETLLKSGQLNPKQYTLMRQNLSDGTDQAFSLLQDYNDEYATKMSMMSADLPVNERLSRMDAWMMEQVEGFANFSETELVINPRSGIMSMAKLIDDPNNKGQLIPDPDPNNLVTVQQLQNRIKSKKTQYDVIGGSKAYIQGLGEQKEIYSKLGSKYKAGIFTTIENIRNREGGFDGKTDAELQVLATEMGVDLSDLKGYNLFQQSQNTYIDGELNSNPDFGCSVLVDFVNQTPDGNEYDMTFNPEDVFVGGDPKNGRIPGKENLILMESKGGRQIPNLSDEQKAVAREAYKAQIDIGLDYKESVQVQQVYKDIKPNQIQIKQGEKKEVQQSALSNVAKLYYGTAQQIKEAETYLKSTNENIIGIDRSGTDVIIEYKDGKRETIPFAAEGGGTLSQAEWVTGASNFFLDNDNKILSPEKTMKNSGIDFSKTLNTTDAVATVGEEQSDVYFTSDGTKEISLDEAVMEVIIDESPAPSEIFKEDNEEESVGLVNAYLVGTDYTVVQYDGGTDDALMLLKDGEETGTVFNLDPGDEYSQIGQYMETLRNIKMDGLTTEDKALKAKRLKKSVKKTRNLRDGQGSGGGAGSGNINTSNY